MYNYRQNNAAFRCAAYFTKRVLNIKSLCLLLDFASENTHDHGTIFSVDLMSENEYGAKDIVVLSGTMGIRKRPAMYIGSTGALGYNHLLYEIIDNAVDEALAGYCNNITIKLEQDSDGYDIAEVSDDGRGIPVDIMPKENRPALEVIMTSIHAGAKFDNKAYKVSGGLHGVGMTVVNALSERTDVIVKRDGKVYRESFSRGAPISGLEIIGETSERGTTIRFKPDKQIFSVNKFDLTTVAERLRDTAFLNSGIRITLSDERFETPEVTKFYSENGMMDFMAYLTEGKTALTKPFVLKKEENDVKIEIAIEYTQGYGEDLYSFVNRIKTPEGGTHVIGFRSGLSRAISAYIQKNVKKQPAQIEGEDMREGLVAIVSVLMPNPEFEGQTKEKLGNTYIKSVFETSVYAKFSEFLEENPSEATKIINKVISAAEAREAARRARELARKKNAFEGTVLPGKLADCTETNPEKSEIFIVEGDSAAGSSKQGRDRFYQAILPLRGKILNVEKATEDKIFNNAELHSLVTALGTGIKEGFQPDKLRYGKIIFLTDADVDGSHIKTLLLTFFYKYMKPLIERGHVFAAQPPLYRIGIGKEVLYAYSDAELNSILKEHNGKGTVQRYKGLGEMNPDQLWETTMNPKNRILRKITIKDAELANSIFIILMGMDVEKRRKFLEEHSTEVSFLDV